MDKYILFGVVSEKQGNAVMGDYFRNTGTHISDNVPEQAAEHENDFLDFKRGYKSHQSGAQRSLK